MRKCLFSVRCLFVSWRATLILLAIYAVLLAMATFIEKVQGTSVARELIYNQPLFYFLQLLMVLQFIAVGIHISPFIILEYCRKTMSLKLMPLHK